MIVRGNFMKWLNDSSDHPTLYSGHMVTESGRQGKIGNTLQKNNDYYNLYMIIMD